MYIYKKCYNRIYKEIRPIAFNAAERQEEDYYLYIHKNNDNKNGNKILDTFRNRRFSI